MLLDFSFPLLAKVFEILDPLPLVTVMITQPICNVAHFGLALPPRQFGRHSYVSLIPVELFLMQ